MRQHDCLNPGSVFQKPGEVRQKHSVRVLARTGEHLTAVDEQNAIVMLDCHTVATNATKATQKRHSNYLGHYISALAK
jgi:hypothetical protein